MSPILVRPVREQLEHDRIIRLLQAKSRRRYEAEVNPGSEQNAPVSGGPSPVYPDLVLYSQERGKRIEAVIEVETGESVNHLEALAQWAHFAKLRPAFHLYCLRAWSMSRAGFARITRFASARSGAIMPSATRCGSRSCTAAGTPSRPLALAARHGRRPPRGGRRRA